MSQNTFRFFPFRKYRFLALVMALFLSLSVITDTFAALIPPPNPFTNGEFGSPGACTTTGWATTGDVSLTTAGAIGATGTVETASDCVAKLQAVNNLGTATIQSTLSQTITVPNVSATNPDATRLCVYVWPNKAFDNQDPGSLNQTIALFSGVSTVYTKTNSLFFISGFTYRFTYDLSAYAGQSVTLKATVIVPRSRTEFYATLLYMDNVRFGDDAVCGSQANHNW